MDQEKPFTAPPRFFKRCWTGQEKLWKAFWLGGLLVAVSTRVLTEIAWQLHLSLVLWIILGIVVLLGNLWWLVSVVRCSDNTSNRLWCWAARIFAFINFVSLLANVALALK